MSAAQKTAIRDHAVNPDVRRRGTRRFFLPEFTAMEPGDRVKKDVEPKVFRKIGTSVGGPGSSRLNCVASEPFEWLMCQQKRLYQTPHTVNGVASALTDFVNRTLPHYDIVVGERFKATELLLECDLIVDFAYLAGVWQYSNALGDKFPPGVRQWPPPDL